MSKNKKILLFVLILLLLIIYVYFYLNKYYEADKVVNDYLSSNNDIKISFKNDYYYFDGSGEENALIFYPGGKVEYTSYAPLLYKLASNGIDCFLVHMPFNLSILNKNKADEILHENYNYKKWYIGGHSLGGAVASMYVSSNNEIDGLILLSAYSNKKLPNNIDVLSIYGTKDGILNMEKYNENKKFFNNNTTQKVIEGANHSQFGNYGLQKGDNEASISRDKQQDETVNYILEFINKLNNNEKEVNNDMIEDKINVVINNNSYILNLEDNDTVKDFMNLLPSEYKMNELNGNEKYIYLDTTLRTNSYSPKRINKGDVMLYGDNCLVVFYKSFNTSYSYTKIGHIDNLPDLGNGNITIKFQKLN